MSNRTIKPSRNYVSKGKRQLFNGVLVDYVDSAELVPRETNVRLLSQQNHINKADLPEIAPARQISDALTIEEYEILGEYVATRMMVSGRYRTTSFEEAVDASRGETAIPLDDREFRNVCLYGYIHHELALKFQDDLALFSDIIDADIGTRKNRRAAATQALYKLGEEIVHRKDKRTQIAGYAAYLKAICICMLEYKRDYFTKLSRIRSEKRRRVEAA